MSKEQYHHGALKKDLILKGLQLLNKEGYEGLSLRKVAVLCGVSHAAPYKHFKNKDELISVITQEVADSFAASLETAVQLYSFDPEKQLIELGKQYVKFMVENPDYLKFLFFSTNNCPVFVKETFSYEANSCFDILKKCAEEYFSSIKLSNNNIISDTLSMWSLVHGITVLVVNKSIVYEGDYLQLVEKMIIDTIIKKYH